MCKSLIELRSEIEKKNFSGRSAPVSARVARLPYAIRPGHGPKPCRPVKRDRACTAAVCGGQVIDSLINERREARRINKKVKIAVGGRTAMAGALRWWRAMVRYGLNPGCRPVVWCDFLVRPPAVAACAHDPTRTSQAVAMLHQAMAVLSSVAYLRRSVRSTMSFGVVPPTRLPQRSQWQEPIPQSGYCLPSRMRDSNIDQPCLASSFSSVAASFNWLRRIRTCLSRSIVNRVSTALSPSFRR